MALVTIILPTHSRALLLPLAVKSILIQTIKDWELFIVGDGATPEIIKEGQKLESENKNIKFKEFPKSESYGESYRHTILNKDATGKYVLYLADDDLWTPIHIEYMVNTLRVNDFAHSQFVRFITKENIEILNNNLGSKYFQQLLLSGENRIPFSTVGHSMETYAHLPYGWRDAPKNIASDLYMWQQFLELENLKAGGGDVPSVLNFPGTLRQDMTELARKNELEDWIDKISYVDYKTQIFEMYIKALHDHTNKIEASIEDRIKEIKSQSDEQISKIDSELKDIKATKLWKLTNKFSKK